MKEKIYCAKKVYTADASFNTVEAFVVQGGRFTDTGSEAELKRRHPGAELVHLAGEAVFPGLCDSHLHILHTGNGLIGLHIKDESKEEILERVRKACMDARPGQWVTGMGWDEVKWDDQRMPDKRELDAVSGDVPVSLARYCGHVAWANSAAMHLAGLDRNAKDPVGGEFLRDAEGDLTGIAIDNAQALLSRAIPVDSLDMQSAKTLAAQKEFLRLGLTSVHDMGALPQTIDLWKSLYGSGRLKVRIYASQKLSGRPTFEGIRDFTADVCRNGMQISDCSGHLTARALKYFLDGSLGARSAWLSSEYSDRAGHMGCGRFTDAELYKLCAAGAASGFQVLCHAIGDAAVHQALNAYEKVCAGDRTRRWRIEHSQIILPSDIARFRALGVIPTCQTRFISDDRLFALQRLGAERMKTSYIWRTLVDHGNPLPNGTDSPVSALNPFEGIYCAITRADPSDLSVKGFYPNEALTRVEALRSYTLWPAYAAFEEDEKGSIERGKYADFIVTDRDIMRCTAQELPSTAVLASYIDGKLEYGSEN